MHVMMKGFCGQREFKHASIAWHTHAVVQLMNSAKGDLLLDRYGNLTTRNVWDEDFKELPFAQHTPGRTLALIGVDGWMLTMEGAQFILENCSPGNDRTTNVLRKIAKGG